MEANSIKNVGIIGLGLIGGSFALALKKYTNATIYGADKHHFSKALSLGLIDKELKSSNQAGMDIIIIATPVNTIGKITLKVLSNINNNCLVFDAGSTKEHIAKEIENHANRQNFLLAHPIAGTEYSGPEAAFSTLFEGKMNIICDTQLTNPHLVEKAKEIFDLLQLKTIEMDSSEHDKHIAYVSHLSHISSFMLGKTVLDLEKNEDNIFQMAGSGFASTVRLAKSSPQTWTPIFLDNKENILQSLEEYIDNLNAFKVMLYRENRSKIEETLQKTNHIKNIIDKIEHK